MKNESEKIATLVKLLTENPMGVTWVEACRRLGAQNVNGYLIIMSNQGYQVAEDEKGGIFLTDVREKYLESIKPRPLHDGRRHGKLLAAYTGNS